MVNRHQGRLMGVALSLERACMMRHETKESVPTMSAQVTGMKARSLSKNITYQCKTIHDTYRDGWARFNTNCTELLMKSILWAFLL